MSVTPQKRLKVLLLAPYFTAESPGESWSTYQWVKGVSEHCDVTVLTIHGQGWEASKSPIGAKELVNWDDVKVPRKLRRLAWELKPGYIKFYRKSRRWILARKEQGWDFDLIHQINPLALRYPCPAAGLGLRYLIGPLAGSLETPQGFAGESTDKQWFRKLRYLDRVRLKYDPLMRKTYAGAELVIGVAPYVEKLLKHLQLKRFRIMSETGIESLPTQRVKDQSCKGPIRLLFVGRIIRTKGVLDAIRAVKKISDEFDVRFDVIGVGDSLEQCQKEAQRLKLTDIVHFHGRLPREELDEWYSKADIFLFPSFREPSGNVVMEALSFGLPIVTCTEGGPGYVVDESCGIRVPALDPEQYSEALAEALKSLLGNSKRRDEFSKGALKRVGELAVWEHKITQLVSCYRELMSQENL